MKIYQSMIGSMQWATIIVRVDIQNAIMTISSFRYQPQIYQLCHFCQMVGYLAKFKSFKIHF